MRQFKDWSKRFSCQQELCGCSLWYRFGEQRRRVATWSD